MEKNITSQSFNTVLENTLQTCNNDEQYQQYSSREKMLAFMFTFLQHLNESDAIYIQQARPFIANYYQSILNTAFLSVLNFWSNDKSDFKQNTDVMVEKTVHFAFDLLAPNAIDSGFDLVQSLFKLSK